jgi:hypothetical protein
MAKLIEYKATTLLGETVAVAAYNTLHAIRGMRDILVVCEGYGPAVAEAALSSEYTTWEVAGLTFTGYENAPADLWRAHL